MTPLTWGSTVWRDAAEHWAHRQLDGLGICPSGAMTDISVQPWSAVWRIPTSRGNVLLKETIRARAAEGAVVAFCAAAAPGYVDPPLAFDRDSGRILLTDGGRTMGASGSTPDAIAEMVNDYANLQQATIGRQQEAAAIGLPVWEPAAAAQETERQAAILHAMPTSDPRHITASQRNQLLTNLDVLTASGAALANSPIPYCLDQGDLWPGNILAPRAPGGAHYRFIDFGDAAWTHPFLSLMPLLFDCHHRWSTSDPSDSDSPDHPALRLITDAYLQNWTGYAESPHLDELLNHALRVAPLRRSQAVITNIRIATKADTRDLGPTPWSWLTAAIQAPAT